MTRRRSAAASAATAALVALSAGASRADAEGRVTVRADPATLVLASEARASLEIEAGGEALPVVTANVGRVQNVRALGGGKFAADYLPPREAYPQVAMVAALAGDRCGWASIPLIGSGVAVARSVPGSPIRVTIGDASFGPVKADATGEAQVPVIVPPGVRFAYQRGKPLELGIPSTARVHLVVARTAAPADAPRDVPLFAFAVTPQGKARDGAPVAVAVSEGSVEGWTETASGAFAGTWRLPAGRAGTATATARIADDPGPAATVEVARPPGAPARLALEAPRARFMAGEDPIALRIRVEDAAGNAVADVPRIEATVGTLSAPAAAGPGQWQTTLLLPAQLGAARLAEIVARAGGAEGRVRLELAPAPPTEVLSVGAGELDGSARLALAAAERRVAVAPKLGVAASTGGLRSTYVGAEAEYGTPLLAGRLRLVLEAGTFVHERTDTVAVGDGSVAVHARARYVPIVASLRWREKLGTAQALWASAGGGLAHVSSVVSTPGATAQQESGAVAALQTSAAWGMRLGPGMPFAEVRLAWHSEPRFETLRGALTLFTIGVGYLYDTH
jgi:hypothetical protein